MKIFNSDGEFIKSYGRKGKGPGEMENVMRMDVSKKGNIMVADPNLRKCVHYKVGKSRDVKIKSSPHGICVFEDYFCALQTSDLNNFSIIERYNFDGENLVSYENIVDLSPYPDLPPFVNTLLGDIISQNKEIFYIPAFMNHIVAYDENGKIRYSVKTIDEVNKIPEMVVQSFPGNYMGAKVPDRDKYTTTLSCAIVEGDIWIASYPAYKEYKKKVFDV